MTVAPGNPGFMLTVNGTGFVLGSVANWNGEPLATTFVGSSQLAATVPAVNVSKPAAALVTIAVVTTGSSSALNSPLGGHTKLMLALAVLGGALGFLAMPGGAAAY